MNNETKILTKEEFEALKKYNKVYKEALNKEYYQFKTLFSLFRKRFLEYEQYNNSRITKEIKEGLILYAKAVNKLKQEGLWGKTKFYLFDALGMTNKEEIHTNLLFWLLNPNESHGLDDKFLKKLIKKISDHEIDNIIIESIKKEKNFGKGGRIDIEIIGYNWILAIENKIKSHEKNNQTNKYEKYYQDIITKSKDISKNNLFLLYLTPNGEKATSDIFKSATYKQIREIIEELKSDFNDEAKFLITQFINHIYYNLEV